MWNSRSLLRVAAVSLGVFLALSGLILIALNRGWLTPWMDSLAAQVSWVLGLLGVGHGLSRADVLLSTRTLRINVDCTAAYIMAIYVAVIVAYPIAWKLKVAALVIGLPVIYAANIVRLVAVAVLSDHLPDMPFRFVHDYLFEVAMVLVVLVLWMTWLDFARSSRVSPDALWFWAIVTVLSVAIGFLIWYLKLGLKAPFDFAGALFLAPALALIVAARGAGWRRKVAFIVGGVLGFALVSLVFEFSGAESVVWGLVPTPGAPFLILTAVFYMFIIGWPVAMVVLFVGRHPERLWYSWEPKAGRTPSSAAE